jgi:hypothetical protein
VLRVARRPLFCADSAPEFEKTHESFHLGCAICIFAPTDMQEAKKLSRVPRSQFERMLLALLYGRGRLRWLAILATLFSVAGVVCIPLSLSFHWPDWAKQTTVLVLGLGAVFASSLKTVQRVEEDVRNRRRIAAAERNLENNPGAPQAAWELARVKLESYLDRNLAQVRSIYALTMVVMAVGFALILAGSYRGFRFPDQFRSAILSSVSGVIVSFIGGTFLVIYKATMAQAKDYVTILERINAVGMSVQILESLTDNPQLKQESMAEIAKQLLHMYSSKLPQAARHRRRSRVPR